MPAATEGDHGATGEAKGLPLGIEDFEVTFDTNGTVAVHCNLGCSHFFSSMRYLGCLQFSYATRLISHWCSVLGNGRIDLVRPSEDSALQI
jgi:hypothetical protein